MTCPAPRATELSRLLVRTGIHQSLSELELLRFCADYGGTPHFLAAAFRW
jgi:hypothetical protein